MSVLAALALTANMLGGDASQLPVAARCLRALRPLAAGSVALSDDFSAVTCPPGSVAQPFRYRLHERSTSLTRSVDSGEIVRAFSEFGTKAIEPGEILVLAGSAGEIRIERDVEALQAAHPGERLFVKGRDGSIFSVSYEDVAR